MNQSDVWGNIFTALPKLQLNLGKRFSIDFGVIPIKGKNIGSKRIDFLYTASFLYHF